MARGRQAGGVDVTAMEMTKWFDTNYHYIVPELGPDMRFSLSSTQAVRRVRGGEGARHRHQAGAGRAALVPAAGQVRRRRARGLRPPRACSSRCSRSTARCSSASRRRARLGAARRARAASRTASERELEALEARLRGAGRGRRAHPDLRQDLLRPRRRGLPRAARPAGRRASGSTSCDGRAAERRADRRRTGGPRTRRCSPASSTAATSGSTTSSAASTCWASCADRATSSSSRPPARCCTRRST